MESRGEEFNKEQNNLNWISNVKKEIFVLLESASELGFENSKQVARLNIVEVLSKYFKGVNQHLSKLGKVLKFREKYSV